MNEYYNNQTGQVPYMGGTPVRCPRCSNVVNNRFCNFCGLDLSTVYFKTQQQQQPQQQQPYQQPIQLPQQPCAQPYQQPIQPPQQPYGQHPYNNNNMYSYPQAPRKNKGWIISLIIIAVVLCIYLLINLVTQALGYWAVFGNKQQNSKDSLSPPHTQEEFHNAGGVSSEEFEKLKNGMSYAQVSSIIGGDGEMVRSEETLKKETSYVYGWAGENNSSAIVYITITTDKVTDISVEGELK